MKDEELLQEAQKKLQEARKARGIPETVNASPWTRVSPVIHDASGFRDWCSRHDCSRPCPQCKALDEVEAEAKRRKAERTAALKSEAIIRNIADVLKECGVPKRFLECTLDTYDLPKKLKSDCLAFAEKPTWGMILSGNTGCGKTSLAVGILREMILRSPKQEALFVPVSSLFIELKKTYSGSCSDTEERIIKHLSTVPFLLLDDLGSRRTTEWVIDIMYAILDARYREILPTLVTTNLSLEMIECEYGAPIASRLAQMRVVTLKLPDYRKRREPQGVKERVVLPYARLGRVKEGSQSDTVADDGSLAEPHP